MNSSREETGSAVGVSLASDQVLAVNPKVTFHWSPRVADGDGRGAGNGPQPTADGYVVLSTLDIEQRKLLALTDGRRRIEDLATVAGLSRSVALRHLQILCERGILVPAASLTGAPPAAPTAWPIEMLAPRDASDTLANGPIEYDYAAPEALTDGVTNPDAMDSSRNPRSAPSIPTVIVEPGMIAMAPGSGLDENVHVEPSGPSNDSRGSQPTKKSPSGPNVTLFWIPSPNDQPPSGPAAETSNAFQRDTSRDASSDSVTAPPTRKSTGEGTVIVMGSPSSVNNRVIGDPALESSGASGQRKVGAGTPEAGVEVLAGGPPPPSSPAEVAVPEASAGGPSTGIPFRVGAYEVATRIAQGAMGSIYVCRRVGAAGFQRLFTLKVVREHSTQKELAIRSFMREARIGSLLDHPNLQKLVDVGTYEDQPFLISEYIEGTNLAELLVDDRRPPVPVAVSIFLDVLRGLQHVHDVADEQGLRSGLIHGDVSPQNILVGVDGIARLTDFGSARFAMEADSNAADPMAVGKPAYMAPEQLRGELGDARTDLFSVGIAMWTTLTGQKLFAAETYDQTAMRVMRRKIPPPSESGAPACLDAIILKALNRAPDGRYSSADEMARELLKAAAAENLVASAHEVGQWIRRELGEALTDRRRTIQDMFGGTTRAPSPPARPQPVRPHKPTPKTADGYDRIPAKTVQINVLPRDFKAPPPAAPAPRPRAAEKNTRSQWYVVILSAVVAGCALVVAIAYLVSSLMSPPRRTPRAAAVGGTVDPAFGTGVRGSALGAPEAAPARSEFVGGPDNAVQSKP